MDVVADVGSSSAKAVQGVTKLTYPFACLTFLFSSEYLLFEIPSMDKTARAEKWTAKRKQARNTHRMQPLQVKVEPVDGRKHMSLLTEYTPVIDMELCGRKWRLERAADLETLWDAMGEEDFGDDERLPYWTELWPSSMVLGEWLFANKEHIAGKHCFDIGCGLGLTALVASWLGARVVAMDYEADAVRFAARNAFINRVPAVLWSVMDWRQPAVTAGSMAYVWGGDIMYEKRFVEPVLQLLDHALASDGKAWVAEPNRTVYEYFMDKLKIEGWQAKRVNTVKTAALYAQKVPVTVNLWELWR